MIRLFIILLIVLVPLRGWSVERMALHMAAGESVSAMSADCPMKVQAAPSDSDSEPTSTSSQRTCQSCQLCMALSSQAIDGLTVSVSAPYRTAPPQSDRFASAVSASISKPPIF